MLLIILILIVSIWIIKKLFWYTLDWIYYHNYGKHEDKIPKTIKSNSKPKLFKQFKF